MPERGRILALTGSQPAERWQRYTTLYLYPAAMCRDLTMDGRRSSLQKARCWARAASTTFWNSAARSARA